MDDDEFQDVIDEEGGELWGDSNDDATTGPQLQTPASQNPDEFPLHRAAFEGDLASVEQLLSSGWSTRERLKLKDPQGNTALHVATIRGHRAIMDALIAAGAPVNAKSARGFTPLYEAVQAKDKALALVLGKAELSQLKAGFKAKRAALVRQGLGGLPDFELEIKWELGSSVPGVGLLLRKFAPHDTYRVRKRGCKLRIDGTLMGVQDEGPLGAPSAHTSAGTSSSSSSSSSSSFLPWERGSFTILYDGSNGGNSSSASMSSTQPPATRQPAAAPAGPHPAPTAAAATTNVALNSTQNGSSHNNGGDGGNNTKMEKQGALLLDNVRRTVMDVRAASKAAGQDSAEQSAIEHDIESMFLTAAGIPSKEHHLHHPPGSEHGRFGGRRRHRGRGGGHQRQDHPLRQKQASAEGGPAANSKGRQQGQGIQSGGGAGDNGDSGQSSKLGKGGLEQEEEEGAEDGVLRGGVPLMSDAEQQQLMEELGLNEEQLEQLLQEQLGVQEEEEEEEGEEEEEAGGQQDDGDEAVLVAAGGLDGLPGPGGSRTQQATAGAAMHPAAGGQLAGGQVQGAEPVIPPSFLAGDHSRSRSSITTSSSTAAVTGPGATSAADAASSASAGTAHSAQNQGASQQERTGGSGGGGGAAEKRGAQPPKQQQGAQEPGEFWVLRHGYKTRDFRFEPVSALLGGQLKETVDGWATKVYEGSAQLARVTRVKARWPPATSWEEYCRADPMPDIVVEMPLNPLNMASGKTACMEMARQAASKQYTAWLEDHPQYRALQGQPPVLGSPARGSQTSVQPSPQQQGTQPRNTQQHHHQQQQQVLVNSTVNDSPQRLQGRPAGKEGPSSQGVAAAGLAGVSTVAGSQPDLHQQGPQRQASGHAAGTSGVGVEAGDDDWASVEGSMASATSSMGGREADHHHLNHHHHHHHHVQQHSHQELQQQLQSSSEEAELVPLTFEQLTAPRQQRQPVPSPPPAPSQQAAAAQMGGRSTPDPSPSATSASGAAAAAVLAPPAPAHSPRQPSPQPAPSLQQQPPQSPAPAAPGPAQVKLQAPPKAPPRRIVGRCWMADGFPLSMHDVLPLLSVIGTANKHLAKVGGFMSRFGDRKEFPVKVQVPIAFTIHVTLSVRAFRWLPPQVTSSSSTSTTSTPSSPAHAPAATLGAGVGAPSSGNGNGPSPSKPASKGGLFSSLGWSRGSSSNSSTPGAASSGTGSNTGAKSSGWTSWMRGGGSKDTGGMFPHLPKAGSPEDADDSHLFQVPAGYTWQEVPLND